MCSTVREQQTEFHISYDYTIEVRIITFLKDLLNFPALLALPNPVKPPKPSLSCPGETRIKMLTNRIADVDFIFSLVIFGLRAEYCAVSKTKKTVFVLIY